MVSIKMVRNGITRTCNGDNDPACHGAWGPGRVRVSGGQRHVSAHVRPVGLEALTLSMVGGVPEHEINPIDDRSDASTPLTIRCTAAIFQVMVA